MIAKDPVGRIKILMLVSVAGMAVILFPPLDALENTILLARMIGDVFLVLYSVLLGYSVDRYLTRTRGEAVGELLGGAYGYLIRLNRATKGFFMGLVIPLFVFTYWNLPANFDPTATSVLLRYEAYLCYVVVACFAGIAVAYTPKLLRIALLLFAFLSVGMMGSMMLVWQPGFYTAYSASQNFQSNSFLMVVGALGELLGGAWSLKALDVI